LLEVYVNDNLKVNRYRYRKHNDNPHLNLITINQSDTDYYYKINLNTNKVILIVKDFKFYNNYKYNINYKL